jgi:hypothetical protein
MSNITVSFYTKDTKKRLTYMTDLNQAHEATIQIRHVFILQPGALPAVAEPLHRGY